VIITGIIVLQINHSSIGMGEKFAEKKVNKLTIFLSDHWVPPLLMLLL
jgi:hypothetical protein